MIRYRYQDQVQPPAPFVAVTIRNPISGAERQDVPAQIDSAADRTMLPAELARELELPRIGEIVVVGLGGVIRSLFLHPIQISIHDLPQHTLEVVACEGEPWVLLGRDLMNQFRLLLDGPQSFLEIG